MARGGKAERCDFLEVTSLCARQPRLSTGDGLDGCGRYRRLVDVGQDLVDACRVRHRVELAEVDPPTARGPRPRVQKGERSEPGFRPQKEIRRTKQSPCPPFPLRVVAVGGDDHLVAITRAGLTLDP